LVKTIKNSRSSAPKKKGSLKDSRELAEQIGQLSLDKKAEDILVFDIREIASFADYFVICSGSSDRHLKAIADSVTEGIFNKYSIKPWHIEGYSYLRWILIDYVDVVVHIFLEDVREFYNLERLWGDAGITEIRDEGNNSGEST